ncbi:hypothetical protein DMA10_07590 [Streptomyces sp. WAC 01420]|nr:hypothetical protein DLM49_00445 [Streptomyces sp. WAC 01438]RSM98983.1 hypothetical protein DMA10_07590 [Streptomyces sp. WAC 01420]
MRCRGTGRRQSWPTQRHPSSTAHWRGTDGPVRRRDRGSDTGVGLPRSALEGTDRTPEDICDSVQVPTRGVRLDPLDVSRVRDGVGRPQAAWGIEELDFATELIAGELMTAVSTSSPRCASAGEPAARPRGRSSGPDQTVPAAQ